MKNNIYVILAAGSLLGMGCASAKYEKGNIEYSKMSYYKAAGYYSAYLQKHNKPEAVARLADSYRQMRDYARAEYWYEKVVYQPNAKPADKLAYAYVLKANGKYAAAKQWYANYLADAPGDATATAQMVSCDSLDAYSNSGTQYTVAPLSINRGNSNFSLTPFQGGYVFVSERGGVSNKVNPWNGRPFLGLFYTTNDTMGNWNQPVQFEGINTPYHNGPVAFTPMFDRIFFSRSDYEKGKLHKGKDDVSNVQLYTAHRCGDHWNDITRLPFNSRDYSCGQPAVSADGKTLFFVSDKPGGFGQTDLYMCSIDTNLQLSEPVNVGAGINTAGNEMFPTYAVSADGTPRLYFSTDGRQGMGGMDLYYAEQQPDGSWGAPVHLPAPMNSSKDDFALTMNEDGRSGYFSSSRNGSGNVDELFSFSSNPRLFVDGVVLNRKTLHTVGQARVQVSNRTNGQSEVVTADDRGKFFMPVMPRSSYVFEASREGYLPGTASLSTHSGNNTETLTVRVFLDSVGYVLSLANIYYDFDKWYIRPDAASQLDTLAAIMKEHPGMTLELDAHADSRGSQRYNIRLTEKRARSVINYLAAHGIERERLEPKWFGKSQPANECKDGVVCTPAKHQQNRRTEFKILSEGDASSYSGYRTK